MDKALYRFFLFKMSVDQSYLSVITVLKLLIAVVYFVCQLFLEATALYPNLDSRAQQWTVG